MAVYRIKDPGGRVMETTAPTPAKARSNFRWRLMRENGMSKWDASRFDFSDLREVRR